MLGDPYLDRSTEASDRTNPRPFLESYRALPVRKREFERLTDATVEGVAALHASVAEPGREPLVQRSPYRCIMQLGPVALTVAWLRCTLDSAADGELLVIVWRGLVATGGTYMPDRTTTSRTPVRSASVLWEEVLTAVAADEPTWRWRPKSADIGGFTSVELAARCVERLRLAHAGDAQRTAARRNSVPT